jgi:hypothetical protein
MQGGKRPVTYRFEKKYNFSKLKRWDHLSNEVSLKNECSRKRCVVQADNPLLQFMRKMLNLLMISMICGD